MRLKTVAKTIKQHTFDRLFPALALERRKRIWEKTWADSNYQPEWRISQVPQELKESVQSNWFSPGSSILDIGCGTGETSAWLAAQGYDVLGIDFSESAIGIAQKIHSQVPGQLGFKVVDVCRDMAKSPRFNGLFDRGCFHTIPKSLAPSYVKTLASWSAPQAKFLLLYATNKGGRENESQEEQRRNQALLFLKDVFEPKFEIVGVQPTLIERGENDLHHASAISVQMVYKG